MNLSMLKQIFTDNKCKNIYVKKMSPNDNSKNQVYLGGSFDILNIFPIQEIHTETSGDWKRDRFKAKINFNWINDNGLLVPAPECQLILYPKYPEVRMSGFLKSCKDAPSELMASRMNGRVLFLASDSKGSVLGYVTSEESEIAKEFNSLTSFSTHGVFSVIELEDQEYNRNKLLAELCRIHNSGWILSKRLNASGDILPCIAPQCGGYTLEAELGIRPNGYSEPDYCGWELKQFNVTNFNNVNSQVITLMTPEPTGGFYNSQGVEQFVRKYGYPDKLGRDDRLNFGGIHKAGTVHSGTNLKLDLKGFDPITGKINDVDGSIALIDQNNEIAASWSFSSLLKHWNRKHNLACYVPSKSKKEPELQYYYGNKIILGSSTDFILFLKQMSAGNIYYDPGIKLENSSSLHPRTKRRSQFRIKSGCLPNLYFKNEVVDLDFIGTLG